MICRNREIELPETTAVVAAMQSADRGNLSAIVVQFIRTACLPTSQIAKMPKPKLPKPRRLAGTLKPARLAALVQSGFRCVYCGRDLLTSPETLLAATIDHVMPKAMAGSDHHTNLVACCRLCNQAKSSIPADSVDQIRPAVLARRQKMIDGIVSQMLTQGVEFALPDESPDQIRQSLELVAVSLVQQADGLVTTLARLERLTTIAAQTDDLT